jgi:hypothetical protein
MSLEFEPKNGTGLAEDSSASGNGHHVVSLVSVASTPDLSISDEFTGGVKHRAGHAGQSTSPGSSERRAGASRPEPIETNFRALEDGSLVDLVEDPSDPRRTLLALWKNGAVTYHQELEIEGQRYIPVQRDAEILRCIPLPRSAEPYASIQDLVRELSTLIRKCVSIDKKCLAPVIGFILDSWVVDRLRVAPYLSVVGLSQSGKTTLLRVLRLLCRRPLLIADPTLAALYEACDRLTPTQLIDETDAVDDPRKLYRLLRTGATGDVVALRKNRVFHNYGLRAFASKEPPNDLALNSRCVRIEMVEANNPRISSVDDENVKKWASKLQAQLLRFRFEKYHNLRIPKLPGSDRLRPRSRDLLRSLAAPCAGHRMFCEDLTVFFQERDILSREALPLPESAVLTALFSTIHQGSYSGFVPVKNLTATVNEILQENKQHFRLQPRRIGAILSSFGITARRRTSRGYLIGLTETDQERIHKLVETHGLDLRIDQFLRRDTTNCHLCPKRARESA